WGHRGLSAAASRSASYVGAAVMGMVRAAMVTLGGCRDVSGAHPHRWAVSLPPSAHETSPPWPPRLCNRRQPFRERGTFCSGLFGDRSHVDGALWMRAVLDRAFIKAIPPGVDMRRIVVALKGVDRVEIHDEL